ncbi:uncharacterized protein LOC111050699 isoform X3 [Nilaparvata lugens]|uniref:uncharacterized protein LOC111050699 isoform X3 n=1 Tax=Nilaparvata lugens TaxID=108931 RepID=UPI00193D854D|nr:uncharacterized protein LOC111050699 isoform X3 [Nilaparvata lugens]
MNIDVHVEMDRFASISKLLFMLLALQIIFLSQSCVEGIKCYQCNSMTHPECINLEKNDTDSFHYRECEEEKVSEKQIFCRKIVQKSNIRSQWLGESGEKVRLGEAPATRVLLGQQQGPRGDRLPMLPRRLQFCNQHYSISWRHSTATSSYRAHCVPLSFLTSFNPAQNN